MTTAEIKALVLREAKSAAHARIVLPLYKTAIETLLAREAEVPAAGPWRTDVENAPKDGSEVMLAWGSEKLGVSVFHWDKENDVWSDGSDGYVENEYIRAFAAINPPETTP